MDFVVFGIIALVIFGAAGFLIRRQRQRIDSMPDYDIEGWRETYEPTETEKENLRKD